LKINKLVHWLKVFQINKSDETIYYKAVHPILEGIKDKNKWFKKKMKSQNILKFLMFFLNRIVKR